MRSTRVSNGETVVEGTTTPGGSPRPAVVEDVLGPRAVRLVDGRVAKLAIAGNYRPAVHDTLLAIDGEEQTWIIGVVSSLRIVDAGDATSRSDEGASVPNATVLRAQDGVEARISDTGETLTVRDRHGVTLFTHDTRTGQSRVEARGDLEVSAPRGHLDLSAARSVRISSSRVELRADAKPGTAQDPSTLTLGPDGASLEVPGLDVTSAQARVSIEDATFAANRLESAVRKARHLSGVVETRAERIIERAKNVFREVDELSQMKAGRLRMVAQGTWSVLSKRSTLKAEEDLSLLGEKIHLA